MFRFLLVCLVTVSCFILVWIFEPAIHYFESVNVNTMGLSHYSVFDRQGSRFALNSIGFLWLSIAFYLCDNSGDRESDLNQDIINFATGAGVVLSVVVPSYNEVTTNHFISS